MPSRVGSKDDATQSTNEQENGQNQSPIDLQDEEVIKCDTEHFEVKDVDKEFCGTIGNTGDSIKIQLPNCGPVVRLGGLPFDDYVIDHICFHWDSEHTVNHQRYPLECHIVTYGVKYGCIYEALEDYGVSVLAVLYQYSANPNPGLGKIVDVMQFISKANSPTNPIPCHSVVISDFLPENLNCFYRYIGSMTTPPYTEGVIWTVFKETLGVSRKQVSELANLFDLEGKMVVTNCRETFPLGERSLYFVCEPATKKVNESSDCSCGELPKKFPNPIKTK